MTYGSETRPFLADVVLKLERAELQMMGVMDVWCFHERQKDK